MRTIPDKRSTLTTTEVAGNAIPPALDVTDEFGAERSLGMISPATALAVATALEEPTMAPEQRDAVTIQSVSFSHGSTPVLDTLSFTIRRGERLAILGPNGSGKSTLLELVTGSTKPDSGQVTVHVPGVAFVPQRSSVSDAVPITVREAVRMGRWQARGRVGRLTRHDHATVDAQIDRLGLNDLATRRLGQLSGGQRQRALIAQALAQEAQLLLLDEPEAGLDAEAQSIIAEVIAEEVDSGTTVVIATHDTTTAAASERLVLLRGHAGGIVADGSPNEVLTDAVLASAFAYRT